MIHRTTTPPPSSDATAFTDYKKRKERANRGKSAEESIKDACEKLVEHWGLAFDWERNPDSRSAGSRKFVARTGDFYMYFKGRCAGIEVKESAQQKLPKQNFDRGQIARGFKRSIAGVVSPVIVHMTLHNAWYVVPIQFFFDNLGPWDVKSFPSFSSASEALDFALAPLFNQ